MFDVPASRLFSSPRSGIDYEYQYDCTQEDERRPEATTRFPSSRRDPMYLTLTTPGTDYGNRKCRITMVRKRFGAVPVHIGPTEFYDERGYNPIGFGKHNPQSQHAEQVCLLSVFLALILE